MDREMNDGQCFARGSVKGVFWRECKEWKCDRSLLRLISSEGIASCLLPSCP